MLIGGDLNADPAEIPCLAKVISAGKLVDRALAYLLVKGNGLLLPASSDWMIVLVLVGISFGVVPMRLLLPLLAKSRIGGFLLIFMIFFGIDGWLVGVSCPLFPSLCGLLAGLTLQKDPPLRLLVLSKMPGVCGCTAVCGSCSWRCGLQVLC